MRMKSRGHDGRSSSMKEAGGGLDAVQEIAANIEELDVVGLGAADHIRKG